jgi:hypothetical protein
MMDRRDLTIRLTNEDQERQYISAMHDYEPWSQAQGQSFEVSTDELLA